LRLCPLRGLAERSNGSDLRWECQEIGFGGKLPTQLPTHERIFGALMEVLHRNILSVFNELAEIA
jgi:hypothetical protein